MESENKKIYKEITEEDLKDDIDVWDVAEPLFLNGIIMKMKNDRLWENFWFSLFLFIFCSKFFSLTFIPKNVIKIFDKFI